jgi:hypothetical protein
MAVCHLGAGTEAGSRGCYVKFGLARPGPGADLAMLSKPRTTSAACSPPGSYRRTFAAPVGTAALALSPDGSWPATARTDRTVRIWDPATGDARAALRLEAAPRHAAAVSADLLVVAGDRGPCFLRLTN